MNSNLVEIMGVFLPVTLIVSCFLISLAIPYLLSLWNTFYGEVNLLYGEKEKLAYLQEEAKKVKMKMDLFNGVFIRMIFFVVCGFSMFCFSFGIFVLIGWIKVYANINRWQSLGGMISGGAVGYGIFCVLLFRARLIAINKNLVVGKTIKLCACTYITLILLSLGVAILTNRMFVQFASNVNNLFFTLLYIEAILLGITTGVGQIFKPARVVNEFRLKILEGLKFSLSSVEEEQSNSIKKEVKKAK